MVQVTAEEDKLDINHIRPCLRYPQEIAVQFQSLQVFHTQNIHWRQWKFWMMIESSDDVDSGSQSLESLMFRFSLPQFVYAVPHHTPNAAQMLDCIYLNTALGNNSKPVPHSLLPRGEQAGWGTCLSSPWKFVVNCHYGPQIQPPAALSKCFPWKAFHAFHLFSKWSTEALHKVPLQTTGTCRELPNPLTLKIMCVVGSDFLPKTSLIN